MISPAYAQTAGAGTGDIFGMLFPLILVFVIFYLLVFRPQQKRMKEHQALLDSVKRGDTVVTAGGIIGKVVRIGNEGELKVEIADGVQVRVLKATITDVRGKGEPVKGESAKDKAKDEEHADSDDDSVNKPAA